MQKLFAISYVVLILFQSLNFGFEDISKFKTLIEHVQYHKEMYGDSLIEFLAEHYGEAQENHQNDHKEHKNLPFKDHHMCTHINMPFINNDTSFDLSYLDFVEIPFNFFYRDCFTSCEKPSVFQPPKYA